MRIPTGWLKEFVDVSSKTTQSIADALSMSGTEVNSIMFPWEYIHGAVSGKIVEINDHPHSEELRTTRVDVGDTALQIVTSDLTVREGETVAVIPSGGSYEDLDIRDRDIRGVNSEGMYLSLEELRLEEDSTRVFRFDGEVEPGLDAKEQLGFDEAVIEVELTPNRGDCLSIKGIARELAAFYGTRLRVPDVPQIDEEERSVGVKIEDKACYRYTALLLESVEVGPSPLWMRKRLVEAGLRPRNNVIDITNYVMLETGHPVHAFDFGRFRSNSILVRTARENETLQLLDKRQVSLEEGDLLITDGTEPVALAGVMGGLKSGIYEDTSSILLEVAVFDPVTIRRTSRRLGIKTDSSYRFERGVDASDSVYVIERLADLMIKHAGAKVASKIEDAGHFEEAEPIHLRKWYVDSVLGTVVPIKKIPQILDALGFELEERGDGWQVKSPPYRHDIEQEIDLVEEVGRVFGYDRVAAKPPRILPIAADLPEEVLKTRRTRRFLTALGYDEAANYSFISPDSIPGLDQGEELVQLKNPISIDMSLMRPYVFAGLLGVASYNYRRQNKDIRVFEVGRTFTGKEELHLAMLATGRENPSDFSDKRETTFYTFKGAVEAFLDFFGASPEFVQYELPWLEKSCAAAIHVEGNNIGFLGTFDKDFAEHSYDIKTGELFIAEIRLDDLSVNRRSDIGKVSFSPFPRIFRDLSFIVPSDIYYEDLERSIRECAPEVLAEVTVTDVYRGKGIPDGHKSITFTLVFESFTGTLKDEEVSRVVEDVVSCVEKLGARLRDS